MKTKLDLYLAVQNAAEASLDLNAKEAEAKLESVLAPLKLATDDDRFARQLFYSRLARMTELRREVFVAATPPSPRVAATPPSPAPKP